MHVKICPFSCGFILGFLFLTVGSLSTVYASEEQLSQGSKVVEAGTITVWGNKEERKSGHAPGMATTISGKDISLKNIQNPAKALENVTGIFVKTGRGGAIANRPGINIRGMDETRCQILRDGHRMNSSFWPSMKSWNQIPVEDIERIEIVKGPYSALYGGWNALGGVINLITKMPERQQLSLKTLYGTDDLRGGTLTYGNRFRDKVSIYLSGEYKETNGYVTDYITKSARDTEEGIPVIGWEETADSKGNPKYLIGDKGDYIIRYWNILAKIGLDLPHDSRLIFSFNPYHYHEHYDRPHNYLKNALTGETVWSGNVTLDDATGPKGMSVQPGDFLTQSEPLTLYRYALDYTIPFGPKNSLKTSFELNDERKERIFWKPDAKQATFSGGPGTYQRNPKSMNWRGRMEWNLKEIYGFNNLTLGAEYYEEKGGRKRWELADWRDKDSKIGVISESWGRNRIISSFVQDEITLIPHLTAYVGGRLDYWKLFNSWAWDKFTGFHPGEEREQAYFSPKFSMEYRPWKETQLSFSVGKSFSAPRLHDLIGGYSRPGYVSLPSPGLKPEKVTSWELGAEQVIARNTRFTCSYFEHHAYDLRYKKTWYADGITYSVYDNADKGRIRGIEIGVEQQVADFLRLFANMTYQDAKIIRNAVKPQTEGKRITGIPQRMFNVGLSVDYGRLKGSLTGHYVSKVYADPLNRDTRNHVPGSYDPYFTLDAKISCEITRGLEISFAVDNLLDRDYYQSSKAPGTYVFGELVYRFGY